MSRDDSNAGIDANRRTLLKGCSAAVAGVAVASGAASADADTEDCGWEYSCIPFECPDGGGDTSQRRYCCNGSCSGWEIIGCC